MMAVRSRMSATVMRVARSWLAAVCVKILFCGAHLPIFREGSHGM